MDLGAATLAAGNVYTVTFSLGAPVLLSKGSGTNWGIMINSQGSTTSGALADNTNITPVLAYNPGSSGYAAGTITTGTSAAFGYNLNVRGQTTFNFGSSDQRTLTTAGANYQG